MTLWAFKEHFLCHGSGSTVAYVYLNPSQKDLRTITDRNVSLLTGIAAGVESGRQGGVRPLV